MTDAAAWHREPGRGRYARPERERRFLVEGEVPPGAVTRLLEDRYLDGLRLRLRRVTRGGQSVHKLTQKVRPVEGDPFEVLLTNMYLSEGEHARLAGLPGADLVKTRSVVATSTDAFVVDVFHGPLLGLRLAELEVTALSDPVDLPSWIGQEVTYDDRFSGGQLALLGDRQWRDLLDPR